MQQVLANDNQKSGRDSIDQHWDWETLLTTSRDVDDFQAQP